MKIELQPQIESLLRAQVEAGLFGSVEEAVAAAVTAAFADSQSDIDLSWAKPYLDAADRDITDGRTVPHIEAWDRLGKRFGLGQG